MFFAVLNKRGNSTDLFQVEFEKEFPRFLTINKTLSTMQSVNQSLVNISSILDSLSEKMVFLNGTNEIEGECICPLVCMIVIIMIMNFSFGTGQETATKIIDS